MKKPPSLFDAVFAFTFLMIVIVVVVGLAYTPKTCWAMDSGYSMAFSRLCDDSRRSEFLAEFPASSHNTRTEDI